MGTQLPVKQTRHLDDHTAYRSAPQPYIGQQANPHPSAPANESNYGKCSVSDTTVYQSVVSAPACEPLLCLETNFASETICDVFEVREGSNDSWKGFNDHGFRQYLKECQSDRLPPSLRVIFVYLEDNKEASFGCRLSMKQKTAIEMIQILPIDLNFVQFLFGKPDYLAPLCIYGTGTNGTAQLGFMCQYPRWHIRHYKKQLPCSIFLSYDSQLERTTYIVSCEKDEGFVNRARKKLSDSCRLYPKTVRDLVAKDPFLLSSILTRESLSDAESVVRQIRLRLYKQLEIADAYSHQPFDRASLKQVTHTLHSISQDCESVFASAEMLAMVVRRTTYAHNRLSTVVSDFQNARMTDFLSYLNEAIEAQKHWIKSYISRKDVAMMLVYQLVTQQDAETTTGIAQAARDDGFVMRIIAIITIIFLPLTVVTSFFGMAFFNTSDRGVYIASTKLWIFWLVALLLTCVVLSISYVWWRWHYIRAWMIMIKDARRINNATPRDDLESGTRVCDTQNGPQMEHDRPKVVDETVVIELKK